MPLDDYSNASDYHDALDQEDARSGITPVSYYTPITPALTPTPTPTPSTSYTGAGYTPPPPRTPPMSATDKVTVDPDSRSISFRPEPETPEHGTYFSDYAKAAWNNVRTMGSDLLGAVNYATQQVSSDPNAMGFAKRWQKSLEDDIDASVKSMSPAAQAALRASMFGDDPDAPSIGDVGLGRYIAINVVSQIPTLLSFFIPGVGGAKGVQFGAKLLGFAEKAASAGKAGGMVATAGFFGAENAGAVYNEIAKNIADAKPEQLQQNPIYLDLVRQGMSPGEAKEHMIQQAAQVIVPLAGLVGAAAGSGVSGMLTHGALGTAERGIISRGMIGAAEGAGLMGAQGGANEALTQGAANVAGTRNDFDPAKVARAFASGAVPGAVFGAIGGIAHRGEQKPAKGIEDTRTGATGQPDVEAALNAALGTQGELDLTQAPAGIPPTGVQGELFRPIGEANAAKPQMTGAPAPEAAPPPPAVTPGVGMPGARQGELPLSGTPPVIPPGSPQGELFPTVPQANPPIATATSPTPTATGAPATAPTLPAAAAKAVDTSKVAATGTGPVEVRELPSKGMKRKDLIDALATMTGEKQSKLQGMKADQLAAMYDREMMKRGEAPPAETAPAPKAAEPVAEPIAEQPAPPKVGEVPVPDQPGGSLTPQAEVAPAGTSEPPAGAAPIVEAKPAEVTPGVTPEPQPRAEQKTQAKPPAAPRAPIAGKLTATKAAAEAIAKSKAVEAKPVDAEAIAKAKATREAEMRAAQEEKKTKAAEKAAAIKKQAAEVRAEQAARKAAQMRAASGESFAVETERGAKAAEVEERAAEGGAAAEEARTTGAQEAALTGETPIATQVFGEGKEKERSEGTTDRKRIQDDLVDEVARGEKTGPEAHAEYEADRRKGGRERTPGYDTLAEGITRRLAESENKALHLELLRQQQEHEDKPDPKLSPRQKQHRTEELNALLENFDPERIENLKDALKQINDPVGHAVENAPLAKSQLTKNLTKIELGGGHTKNVLRAMYEIEHLQDRMPAGATAEDRAAYERGILHRRGVTDKDLTTIHKRLEAVPKVHRAAVEAELARRYSPRAAGVDDTLRQGGVVPEGLPHRLASRYVRVANDPRLHEDLRRDIRASEEHGVAYTPKAALETIIRSSALKTEQRPLWELARKLYDRVDDNVPIISFEEAQRRGYSSIYYNRENGPNGTHGYYTHTGPRSDGQRHIGINMHTPVTAQTLLHEIAHSVTTDHLNHLLRTDPNHREIHALRTIGTELANHARLNKEAIPPEIWSRLVHTTSDVREVHTWLLTNPEVQAFAASHQASPQFRRIMAQLGYEPRTQGNSIWRYFVDWTRHALGLDKPKSASEYTLLDHVMRPVTDILDASIKHNERLRPSDPVLRMHSDALRQGSSDFLRDAARSAIDRFRPSNLPDRLFNAVLGASNVDAIVSHHGDKLTGLRDYQVERDKITRAGAEAAEKYGDKVRGLLKTWGKLDDQKALGSLMNKASIGEMYLGKGVKPDANDHLTTPEQKAALKEAQAEYDKLPQSAKDFYDETKGLYQQIYKERQDAELTGSLRAFLPDLTPEQEKAFVDAARTKERLEKFMADPDSSEIAKAFGTKWEENRDIAKIVARAHSYGYVKGDYFPQRRYGKYVVKYGKDESHGVEFFDRKSKAEERRAELIKQGEHDVWQVMRHDQKFTKDIRADHPAVAELEQAMTRKGFTEAQAEHARDLLTSILVNHMADGQAQKMRLRRQGIIGADTNHARVLTNEFVNHVNRIGYLLHGAGRQAAIDKMWSQVRDMERPGQSSDDANRMTMVIQSLEKRQTRPEDMNNSFQRTLAHVNGLNYVISLMSPSHMVTSTMEAHTNSIALLGGRHGVLKSTAAVAKNLARALPVMGKTPDAMLAAVRHDLQSAHWNVLDMLMKRFEAVPGVNKELLKGVHGMLQQSGLVDHTMTSDLHRQMNPESVFGGKVAGMWERVSDTNQIMAHFVDAANRFVSAYSAAELELASKKNTNGVAGAVEYAEKIARRVAPNYTAGNRELLTSPSGPIGVWGAPLMQFKRYGLHMYAMMGNLTKESMRAGTSAERWEARKSLAYLMGSHAMMAGVIGLPTTDAIRYIGGAWDLFHGRAPHNYQNDMRAAIANVFGKTAGELISRGLPHALGFDVHRRVSLNNLLEMPELSDFGKKGIGEALMHLVTGATGENLTNAMAGAEKLFQGDFGGAAKAYLPRIVRDPMKAIELASHGVVDSKGHTILPAQKLTPYDIGLQAAGFQPSRVSETREGRSAVLEAREERTAERSHLETRWLEGNPSERAAAWQAIVAYNAANPTARITRDQLLQQEKASKKSSATYGLRLPRAQTRDLMHAGAFANAS